MQVSVNSLVRLQGFLKHVSVDAADVRRKDSQIDMYTNRQGTFDKEVLWQKRSLTANVRFDNIFLENHVMYKLIETLDTFMSSKVGRCIYIQ